MSDVEEFEEVEEWPITIWVILNFLVLLTSTAFICIFCNFQAKHNLDCVGNCKKEKPQTIGFLAIVSNLLFSAFAIIFSTNIVFPWDFTNWDVPDAYVSHYMMSMFFWLGKSLFYVMFVYRIRQLYVFEAKIKYYLILLWEITLYLFIVVALIEQALTPFTLKKTNLNGYMVWNFPDDTNEAEAGSTVIAISAIIVVVLYVRRLKKVAQGDGRVRKRTLYPLLKEAVLLIISSVVGLIVFIGVAVDDTNYGPVNHLMCWLSPLTTLTDVFCIFLEFRMSDRIFFRLCGCCSLCLLHCCNLYERGDERMLEIAKNTDLDGTQGAVRSPAALAGNSTFRSGLDGDKFTY